jgi:hypothetical protein
MVSLVVPKHKEHKIWTTKNMQYSTGTHHRSEVAAGVSDPNASRWGIRPKYKLTGTVERPSLWPAHCKLNLWTIDTPPKAQQQ